MQLKVRAEKTLTNQIKARISVYLAIILSSSITVEDVTSFRFNYLQLLCI